MTVDRNLPALRAIQLTPFEHVDGRLFFELRDMLQIAPRPIAVSGAACFVLAHLDGQHTIADVQRAFREQTGQHLPADEIEHLVAILDSHCFLDTPRFADALAAQAEAYQAAACRDNRDRWPAADELRAAIDAMLCATEVEPIPHLRGIIAPHLDYRRGAPCYAAAYALLRNAGPADRYVIFGANHFGRSASAVATKKDFQTPLGRAVTDRAFIRRLEDRLGVDLCRFELDHRTEHSIELQVHVLQYCWPDGEFEIVPILCPDICGPTGTAPANGYGPDLADLADAVREIAQTDDRSTVLIAGADLSHVGRSFGADEPMTPDKLAELERFDRTVLGLIEIGDVEAAAEMVRASANETNICSLGALYVWRRALRNQQCRLLRYHQALDPETDTNVTCAAAAAW